MSNIVTFSGRSINMSDSPVAEVDGMTPERQRELLMASGLGQTVLLSAEFAFPPKGPPQAAPPQQPPPMPPPQPPAAKAPHVAIHVHAPASGAPPDDGSGTMPPDGSMPPEEMPQEEDKTPQVEAFLATMPDDLTIDDLMEYFENMEPSDDEGDEEGMDEEEPASAPPGKKKPVPAFSMTAAEMFASE